MCITIHATEPVRAALAGSPAADDDPIGFTANPSAGDGMLRRTAVGADTLNVRIVPCPVPDPAGEVAGLSRDGSSV